MRERSDVAGVARAFKAMNHHKLRYWLGRSLCFHQNFYVRLCAVKLALCWVSAEIKITRPEVPENGERVRVLEDGNKRLHVVV